MNHQIFDKASAVISDAPLLVNIISKRVRQLTDGSRPMIASDRPMGFMEIALTEVAQHKLTADRLRQDAPDRSASAKSPAAKGRSAKK